MLAKIFICNDLQLLETKLVEHLNSYKIKRTSPDVLWYEADSKLGVDQAKQINSHFSLKPFQETGRVVVISQAQNLTDAAQNALLKTIEELPHQAIFILGADQSNQLLPTFLSRIEQQLIQSDDSTNLTAAQDFLKADIEKRFSLVEKLDERQELINQLAKWSEKQLVKDPKVLSAAKNCLLAKKWSEQNVNSRSILEWLALSLPTL